MDATLAHARVLEWRLLLLTQDIGHVLTDPIRFSYFGRMLANEDVHICQTVCLCCVDSNKGSGLPKMA